MCNATVEVDPCQLYDVPDHLKTQELCIKAIELDPFSSQYVPKWWVSQLHIELWNSDDYYCNDDEVTEWYKGYKKPKKPQQKKNSYPLLGIHQVTGIGVFLKTKKETEKLWA